MTASPEVDPLLEAAVAAAKHRYVIVVHARVVKATPTRRAAHRWAAREYPGADRGRGAWVHVYDRKTLKRLDPPPPKGLS